MDGFWQLSLEEVWEAMVAWVSSDTPAAFAAYLDQVPPASHCVASDSPVSPRCVTTRIRASTLPSIRSYPLHSVRHQAHHTLRSQRPARKPPRLLRGAAAQTLRVATRRPASLPSVPPASEPLRAASLPASAGMSLSKPSR